VHGLPTASSFSLLTQLTCERAHLVRERVNDNSRVTVRPLSEASAIPDGIWYTGEFSEMGLPRKRCYIRESV